MNSENLIYGLVDPRTLLVRYVGLSSRGLKRPKEHRYASSGFYCHHWIKSLKALGLNYEIVVLETVEDAAALDQAERWWIAYGRACGWPLTNLTDGGGPTEAALAARRERDLARTARKRYSQEHIARLIEARKLRENEIETEMRARINAMLARRNGGTVQDLPTPEVRDRCFALFEKHFDSNQLFVDVVIGARVTFETAMGLYKEWLQVSGKEDRSLKQFEQRRAARLAEEKKNVMSPWTRARVAEAKRLFEESRKSA